MAVNENNLYNTLTDKYSNNYLYKCKSTRITTTKVLGNIVPDKILFLLCFRKKNKTWHLGD